MRFGRSPWFVSAIGGAFAPNAAFLPVLCAMVSGSMGRCTSSNRYGDAIDTDRVPPGVGLRSGGDALGGAEMLFGLAGSWRAVAVRGGGRSVVRGGGVSGGGVLGGSVSGGGGVAGGVV
jgi:hypothetical protein